MTPERQFVLDYLGRERWWTVRQLAALKAGSSHFLTTGEKQFTGCTAMSRLLVRMWEDGLVKRKLFHQNTEELWMLPEVRIPRQGKAEHEKCGTDLCVAYVTSGILREWSLTAPAQVLKTGIIPDRLAVFDYQDKVYVVAFEVDMDTEKDLNILHEKCRGYIAYAKRNNKHLSVIFTVPTVERGLVVLNEVLLKHHNKQVYFFVALHKNVLANPLNPLLRGPIKPEISLPLTALAPVI